MKKLIQGVLALALVITFSTNISADTVEASGCGWDTKPHLCHPTD